jgi:hypothetical protein
MVLLKAPDNYDSVEGASAISCFEMENAFNNPTEDEGWPELGDRGFTIEFESNGVNVAGFTPTRFDFILSTTNRGDFSKDPTRTDNFQVTLNSVDATTNVMNLTISASRWADPMFRNNPRCFYQHAAHDAKVAPNLRLYPDPQGTEPVVAVERMNFPR